MGIVVKIIGMEEEINLTDFTVDKYNERLDPADGLNEFMSNDLHGIELYGKVNFYDTTAEAIEMCKLSDWSRKTAHEDDAYRKMQVSLLDTNGEEYDSLEFEKAFIMKYEENNDEQKGNAEFYVFIREFKEEELVIKPIAAKPQVSQEEVVGSFENEQNSTGGSGAAFISANNTEYASNVSSEGNLIALFKKHGGTVETVEARIGYGTHCIHKGTISFGDKGKLYLNIEEDSFYYSATSQESDKEFIEEFDSEKLNPQKVVRQGSEWYEKERSWSFVRDGIDYVVDEEYFEEIIQKCTASIKEDGLADKYFAKDALKIRATPNGQQLGGIKIFIKGAIVRIHPTKEIQKTEGMDDIWVKVFYDTDKVGWVSKNYLEELPRPVSGYKFKYNWGKSQYVTQDFMDKATGVAKALGVDPDDLMAIMAFESYLNPAQKNLKGGSATGLIQFMPPVAAALHTTTNELAGMTGVDQLDYVFGYFYPHVGKLKTLSDLYVGTLAPSYIGEGENKILYQGDENYEANKGLDANNDGMLTVGEAVQSVINRRNEYLF